MNADEEVDPMLQMFVGGVNDTGIQAPITLLVGGTWISGTLIPPRMFSEELRLKYRSIGATPVEEFFQYIGKEWFPSESEADAGLADPSNVVEGRDPEYIHLRNARAVLVQGWVPTDGQYLRLRMSKVQAWSVGELGPPGYAPPPPPIPDL